MKNLYLYTFLLFIPISPIFSETLVDYVDPRIGATRLGNTYPAVCLPFGLCKWTPQTRSGEIKGDKPYDYQDTKLQGIRWSNFISGSAVPEYGSHTFYAMTGEFKIDPADRAAEFSHANEITTPYNYSVILDNGIQIEVTATERCGYIRFKYPKAVDAKIVLQPNNRPRAEHTREDAYIEIMSERNEIVGYNPVSRYYISTGQPAGFAGYFVARINKPIVAYQLWQNESLIAGKSATGQTGIFITYETKQNETIEMKIGCSFSSIEQARKNLDAEIPRWDFQQIKTDAKKKWENQLSRIVVQGGEEDKIKFYTAMYHSLLLPHIFNDVDGVYPGFAGAGLKQATDFCYYDDFSLWDTFRAEHPLLLLIQPERIADMIRSLLAKADQGGWLPIFPAWNSYTTEMIGDHAFSVITDSYIKGYTQFDAEKAFAYMKKNAVSPPSYADYADGKGRRAVLAQRLLGFVPVEHPIQEAFHQREQVSRTLEYAYDDFCLSQFAQALRKPQDAAEFRRQALNYQNVFDSTTGFVRGRTIDGYWTEPFDPTRHYSYICEATPWIYTWFVPHDIGNLIRLMGGKQAFIAKLDDFFQNGYYAHDNEPSHQIAYLYNYAGAPYKTQERVRAAMANNYTIQPGGLTGNDDAGQMSAWYIFSSLGFYPVCPGTDQYIIGSPIFEQATITLHPPRYKEGTVLTIRAHQVSQTNLYIQSLTINGQPWQKSWFSHNDIEQGGEIIFEMGPTPNPEWGSASDSAPLSMSTTEDDARQ
ncbi:MAG: glycoside hydrolase family 92 protein [Calditrichaeota bacterium]|nr:MAG: glycoside hydrolase family 92 protein [Calditrichota bacterium]